MRKTTQHRLPSNPGEEVELWVDPYMLPLYLYVKDETPFVILDESDANGENMALKVRAYLTGDVLSRDDVYMGSVFIRDKLLHFYYYWA